jgi:site-specific recombinase XerD
MTEKLAAASHITPGTGTTAAQPSSTQAAPDRNEEYLAAFGESSHRIKKSDAALSPVTVKQYQDQVRDFAEWLGEDLASAAPNDLTAYLESMVAGGTRHATVNLRRSGISNFYVFMHERGFVSQNPAAELIRFEEEKRPPRTLLTPAEILHLHKALNSGSLSIRNSLVVGLAFYECLRTSEIVSLELAGIKLDSREIALDGRSVKIWQPDFQENLRFQINAQRLASATYNTPATFLITTERQTDQKMTRSAIWHLTKKTLEETGLSAAFSGESLRLSGAVALYHSNNSNMALAKRFLNHADISSTQTVLSPYVNETGYKLAEFRM